MEAGKLYSSDGEEFIANVNYQFHSKSATSWWGELVLTEYMRLSDGDSYVLQLWDGRRGLCYLRKRVNRAVSGVPPLYYYNFRGFGQLK